jgi:hypothetical protein
MGLKEDPDCPITEKPPAAAHFSEGQRVVATHTKERGVITLVRWADVGVHIDGRPPRVVSFFPHQHLVLEDEFDAYEEETARVISSKPPDPFAD